MGQSQAAHQAGQATTRVDCLCATFASGLRRRSLRHDQLYEAMVLGLRSYRTLFSLTWLFEFNLATMCPGFSARHHHGRQFANRTLLVPLPLSLGG